MTLKMNKTALRTLCASALIMGVSTFSNAGAAVDQLSDCLVKSTTAADKTTVLQWTYSALSTHPDLKGFSNVSAEQRTALDQKLAQVLQRVIVEQCSTQTKAVIQAEGIQAVGESFQALGRSAGEEIIKNPEVNNQLKGVVRYIDLNKLVATFLTPDIWNKLGITR
ncbi:signal peptide protein [Acinetobacter sp. Ver3]|nr:signal peptide protein [Acinetobacter sp. Ver3]